MNDDGADDGKPLRSDAGRNRDRIVAAARSVFAREGLTASMASVARHADVGIATLFRRFPTKDELIEAVFADRMDAYVDAVVTALADPDPWHAFAGYVETVCGMQAADRGFAGVLTMTFPMATTLESRRREAYDGLVRLIERAKAAGRLRDDFTAEDMVLLLMANAGVVAATAEAAPTAWSRIVALIVQGLQAPARGALPTAPEPSDLYQAMLRAASVAPSRQTTN
ncbi:TetR/AcrR family transcriptional regulator [Mycolicibacterium wolinskyi]|uniref:TetR family transcriptional regulator n=1 Tax=Mycolicibacterium wolinskyi TaxID=59750 RepID=A0A1X2F229_9MYCO|nr:MULTISPECIES: TetR/AcrR family transcriptional regulator [Mycolicibacterium]MCV7287799.1 TetR/AcrR family transcriptional regulator [Mycolicibacterium wolinskyi]MCV7294697.1 TetR/AcrR family transcriptional regulator [Mycolicibacterium goodii]ORX12438.1 TetR family transcriptional regulator [Mycolicibacterium wolinskyi]